LLMQLMSFLEIRPLGVSLGRPLPRVFRHMPSELLHGIIIHFTLSSALLFGLVLVFVLLLVGAVLSEHKSRQELASANQRLRQYALLIENQATLQERNRIAREIHDSVGHSLAAQSIQLENVAMLLPEEGGKLAHHLHKARQLGKEALKHVRQSVATLRNHPLQGQSLPTALTKLLKEFEATTCIQLDANINLNSSLSAEIATALYRVTQEALTNISKHSNASQVCLQLLESNGERGRGGEGEMGRWEDTERGRWGDGKTRRGGDGEMGRGGDRKVSLLLADNGRGFDPQENTTGFGLEGMRERTEALGGSFYLISQPGQGCKIKVDIPLPG
ncbi:MAG: sensor histidine kinase, partial [Symploca sp. SIO1C4]|nr:sensor histidine kinase [Symploca sp. SIO1C4]